MEKRLFGVLDCGKKVYAYTLKNEKISLTVLDYGATIQSLTFEDRDVVLGYDTLEGYVNNDGYLGAVVGRVANRISGSSFKLNGKKYSLYANDGKNSLHGGKIGFDKVVWAVADIYSNSITFQYLSPDKEEGYPGNLLVKVKYYVKENGVGIEYGATCDEDTVINLSNHTYFNLYDEGLAEDQFLTLYADKFTPVGNGLIPTGDIVPVRNTPFDFTLIKRIGKDIEENDAQLKIAGGYDHNFVINGEGFRKFAEVSSPKSGIKMLGYTDQPGVQFYTANFLTERVGKRGKKMTRRGGFCLETQNFPDAINKPQFPSSVLKAGDFYHTVTEFEFVNY